MFNFAMRVQEEALQRRTKMLDRKVQKEKAIEQWLEDLWKDVADYENIDHIQMGIEEAIDYVKGK